MMHVACCDSHYLYVLASLNPTVIGNLTGGAFMFTNHKISLNKLCLSTSDSPS